MTRLSIVGPGEYDDVYVEIDFAPAFHANVRWENDRYYVEVFNCSPEQIEEFANGKKLLRNSVDLAELVAAIDRAKELLRYQHGNLEE